MGLAPVFLQVYFDSLIQYNLTRDDNKKLATIMLGLNNAK